MMIWILLIPFLFAQDPQLEADASIEDAPPPQEIQGDASPGGEIPPPAAASQSLVKRLTEPFLYDPEDKRDPFILPETRETPLLPGAYFGPFLPLQEIPLKEVVIKGIILDRVKSKAILEIVDYKGKKKLVKVSVGDYLGENFGVIQAIHEGKVIVVQTLGEGEQKSTSTFTLTIRK